MAFILTSKNIRNPRISLPGFILAGIFLGVLISRSPNLAAVIGFSLPLLLFIFTKPAWGIITVVFLTASFLHELPYLSIGAISFHISDGILLFLISTVIVRAFAVPGASFVRTPLDIPLLGFLFAVFVGLLIAVFVQDIPFNIAMRQVRILAYYSIFFLVTHCINDLKKIKMLINSLFILAALVIAALILQSFSGGTIPFISGYMAGNVIMDSEFVRVGLSGLPLVLICMMAILSVLLMSGPSSPKYILLAEFLFLSAGMVLTFTRSYWIVMLLCFSFILRYTPFARRLKILFSMILLVPVSYFLLIALVPAKTFDSYGLALTKRFMTLFQGRDTLKIDTVADRVTEYDYALQEIKSSPIYGIGLRNDYRPAFYGPDDQLTWYIHNSYLWVLKDMGFLGLIPFMIFYIGSLVRGFKKWNSVENQFLRAIVLGNTIGILGLMLFALQGGVLVNSWNTSVYGCVIGLNEVIYKLKAVE